MRKQALLLKKRLLELEDKEINTTCTIPKWQLYRVKSIRRTLQNDLLKAGYSIKIIEGQLELICLKLFIRQMNSRKRQPERAICYNDERHNYSRVNLCFDNADDYFLFRSKRNHLRISVSYMMDLALRLYLQMAARILFLRLTGGLLKTKWIFLLENFNIYYEKTDIDSISELKYEEQHRNRWSSG